MICLQNHGEGGSEQVQLRLQLRGCPKRLGAASLSLLCFEHKIKLEQFTIEIGPFDDKVS
jgi:hypothetical protein